MNNLKAHFLQHTRAYVIVGAAGGTIVVGLACLAFVLFRLILPARPTPIFTPTSTPTLIATPEATSCTQPPMPVAPPATFNTSETTTTVVTALPGRAGDPLPFLEIPFPYDGGNENFGGTDAQFRRASQRVSMGGRIISFFDHQYPLYPSPKARAVTAGREPGDSPIGDRVLTFDGTASAYDNYSGHPAYDFSPFVPRTNTTPVFAAADGLIHYAGVHAASGAYYIQIKHTVVGVGDFLTIYWHLNPDQIFEATRSRVGQPIAAGTRIATMDNTGWSTGTHLHFEVRFDRNRDGQFTGDETIDPYGFTPSAAYPVDPWGVPQSFVDALGQPYHHAASISWYLWKHPLGVTVQVPPDGGGAINLSISPVATTTTSITPTANPLACAPQGSLPPGGFVNWSMSPDPRPTLDQAGTGNSHVLSVFNPQGQPVTHFDPPIEIEIPFDQTDLANVDPNTLIIYRSDADKEEWTPLPTRLDLQKRVAFALTDRPGRFGLFGKPTRDLVPPTTDIQLDGVTAPDGGFYDKVTVTLISTDTSGIKQIEYSIDGGNTWVTYTHPFTLTPNGIPAPLPDDAGETFGGGPGRFLVLAMATDGAGNVEEPPAYRSIVIDPSKAPTPTLTATPTATPTRRPPTRTPTPTATPTQVPISFFAKPNPIVTGACTILRWDVDNVKTVRLDKEGVTGHSQREVCLYETTVFVLNVKLNDDTLRAVPLTVTVNLIPKSTDDVPPPPPTNLQPNTDGQLACTQKVTLTWDPSSDPSGIIRYDWYVAAAPNFRVISGGVVASGSTAGLTAKATVECGSTYVWAVRAIDGAGNTGVYSQPAYLPLAPP